MDDESVNHYQVDLSQETQPAISWEMDEYLQHKRGLAWYAMLFLIAVGISLIAYLVSSQELIAPISIMVMAIILAIYSFKKPQRHRYSISELGLRIGSRLYEYSSFKAFSLTQDNGVSALYLITNQRFVPPLTIYMPADKTESIIDQLSEYIPFSTEDSQWLDRLMSYFRF